MIQKVCFTLTQACLYECVLPGDKMFYIEWNFTIVLQQLCVFVHGYRQINIYLQNLYVQRIKQKRDDVKKAKFSDNMNENYLGTQLGGVLSTSHAAKSFIGTGLEVPEARSPFPLSVIFTVASVTLLLLYLSNKRSKNST